MTDAVTTPGSETTPDGLPETPALNPAELAARAWDLCFLRPLEAMRDADRAIALAGHDKPKPRARATLSRAVARSIFSDYESALKDAKAASELARDCDDLRLEAWGHCVRSQIELARDHLDDAGNAINEADAGFSLQEDTAGRARLLNLRAALAHRRGNAEETKRLLNADEHAFVYDYPYEAGYAHSTLGNVYDARAEYDLALHHHHQALKLRREAGDKFGEAGSLNNIGNVQYQLGRYEDALESHQNGLVLRKELRNPVAIGASLSNIGLILFVLERHQEAEHTLREAMKIQEASNDHQGASNTRANLAHALSAMGRDDEALELARDSATTLAAVGDRRGESSAWLCVGETILRRESPADEALTDAALCFEKALEIGNGIDAPEIVYRAHQGLALSYRLRFDRSDASDDAHRAMEHWQRFYETERSVFNERARRNAHQLQAEYKTARAEYDRNLEQVRADGLQERNSKLESLNNRLEAANRDKAAMLKELRRQKAELERFAIKDALTGALNRGALDKSLATEFDRYRRYQHELALIMVDLDDFKPINDQISHRAGDEALRQIARILEAQIRHLDAVGRYGGDEFIVLLPETELDRALVVAERIREAIENYDWRTLLDSDLKLTASIGVATTATVESPEGLIEAADEQLYLAKASGRNAVRG